MSTTYASEALLGPPSQPVSLRQFILRCSRSPGQDVERETLSDNHAASVQDECSVADLQESLNDTLSNPFKYSFLIRGYENNIQSIRSALKSTGQVSNTSKSRKRKRPVESVNPDNTTSLTPSNSELSQLQSNLDNIALSCWPYPTDAALFTRPQKNSDLNVLSTPVSGERSERAAATAAISCSLSSQKYSRSRSPEEQQSRQRQHRSSLLPLISLHEPREKEDSDAVLVISIYNRLSWGNHLSRTSQHAILASQTIGELYDVIPCPSNEIPHGFAEVEEDGESKGYNSDAGSEFIPPTVAPHRGAVLCIEGVAYGDGQAEEDYADKLIQQIELLPEKKRSQVALTKGACMYDRRFVDMTVRLNQAYWLLHQGTCEHFMVIDSIRMLHPEDPKDGYPLTLHIAPPIVDLCMACSRVPATLSIVGDIRLGQTPFKICKPCWTLLGEPNSEEKIEIVSLPKHEHGW